MKKLFLLFLVYTCCLSAIAQDHITGTVRSSTDGQPLPGVSIMVKGTTLGTTTDADGSYSIAARPADVLVFSFIGYAPQEITIGAESLLNIELTEDISTLDEITIVSTGYEILPKERATGSFAHLDNELLNRRIGADILSRLEDVTSGLIFNRNIEGQPSSISIRGRSTINGNASPLIVIDNFPYDGDINNINPNDIETVTVLKDAAAASIWGARAGNGVIVLTTKKGKKDQPIQVSINSNITWGKRPDVFYADRISSADFIGVEQMMFNKGYYESKESSSANPALTPAVELMIANRDGALSEADLNSSLAELAQHDVRNEYKKYIYRSSMNQQYAINLRGGSSRNQYFISAGLDRNKESLVRNDNSRMTLNAGNTWHLLRDKLTFSADMYYAETARNNNNGGINPISFDSNPMYPYASFKDQDGNNLPVAHSYREGFVRQAQENGLLNWEYNPLDEIQDSDNTSALKDYRVNTRLHYQITPHLSAEALYQYWQSNTQVKNYRSTETYFTRNMINSYTEDNGSGSLLYNVPNNGILDRYSQQSVSHNFRAQANYANTWGAHAFNILGGYEVKEINTESNSYRYYGYNDDLATNQLVNYISFFPIYSNSGRTAQIPNNEGVSALTDRFISYYLNGSYSFNKRYTASFSARKDQSNLFGVSTNQKGVPLWSAGLAWILSEESVLATSAFPYLKLRSTFGYNGNSDKSVTAYTTAISLGADPLTGLPYATIINPPNPELRWEKVKIWNTGLDFETSNRTLSGSIEYYTKWGIDLIGNAPYPPSSGIINFRGNNANTRGHGIDIVLNSANLTGNVKWNTTFLYSLLKEKVTTYKTNIPAINYVTDAANNAYSTYPLEGKPLYAVYSFDWGGLNPENGKPLGIIDGAVSDDYSSIINEATTASIHYHGSARPTSFGSLRNTLSWKNISLSFNISYRLGYYFKMNSVRYSSVLNGIVSHGDYARRWQNPGDEVSTSVPSMPDTPDANRDNFYLNSSVLVEKGDYIRFQDINLSYSLDKSILSRLPVTRIQVYLYANNIGILWKATDKHIDPDYAIMKPVRTLATGIRIDF